MKRLAPFHEAHFLFSSRRIAFKAQNQTCHHPFGTTHGGTWTDHAPRARHCVLTDDELDRAANGAVMDNECPPAAPRAAARSIALRCGTSCDRPSELSQQPEVAQTCKQHRHLYIGCRSPTQTALRALPIPRLLGGIVTLPNYHLKRRVSARRHSRPRDNAELGDSYVMPRLDLYEAISLVTNCQSLA